MLVSIKRLMQYEIHALDGHLSRAEDFLFFQGEWQVSYFQVNAPGEPQGKRIFLPVAAFLTPSHKKYNLYVNYTLDQISDLPDMSLEVDNADVKKTYVHDFYGWPPDWLEPEYQITPSSEITKEPELTEFHTETPPPEPDVDATGPELQKVSEILDFFHVQTNDSELSTVTDFLVDDETWVMAYLICFNGMEDAKPIFVSTDAIERAVWPDGHFYVDSSLDQLKTPPAFERQPLMADESL